MIHALHQEYQQRAAQSESRLAEVLEGCSAIDIVNDANLRVESDVSDDLSKQSLTQLNQKAVDADTALALLNRLWVVKGLIQETETLLEVDVDHEDLQTILHNLKKLEARVSELDDLLLIKGELNKRLVSLNGQLNKTLLRLANLFFVSTEDESTIRREIPTGDTTLSLQVFLHLSEEFSALSTITDVKLVLEDHKHKWDGVLGQLIAKKKYLVLDEGGVTLGLIDALPGSSFFSEYYFRSLTNFVKFIDTLESASFTNYYSNKVSNTFTATISENINLLYNNEALLDEMQLFLDTVQRSNWLLSVMRTFSSSERVSEQLDKLYGDYVLEKYINEVRSYFTTTFDSDKADVADWDKDAWDDEWDDGWGEADKTSPAETVTGAVASLAAIVTKYQQETKYGGDELLLAVVCLALVLYPPLKELFLVFNDLLALAQQLQLEYLERTAGSLLSQLHMELSNEVYQILLKLDIDSETPLNGAPLEFWLDKLAKTQLKSTNLARYKALLVELLEVAHDWLVRKIITADEITEFRSEAYTNVIDRLRQVSTRLLGDIGEGPKAVKLFDKLAQLLILINNHLKDIMDYFYQGDLFELLTEELTTVLRSVFVQSDIRDGYIREIIEIRLEQ